MIVSLIRVIHESYGERGFEFRSAQPFKEPEAGRRGEGEGTCL
jgi:hypothetical protein